MPGDFQFGAVLAWDEWEFEDGDSSDKLLIVLGAKAGKDFLVVLTTSRPPPKKTLTIGCNAPVGYYLIPGKKECFPKDTYVQLYRPQVVTAAEVIKGKFADKVRVRANLRKDIAAAIRNCLKQSPYAAPIFLELAE